MRMHTAVQFVFFVHIVPDALSALTANEDERASYGSLLLQIPGEPQVVVHKTLRQRSSPLRHPSVAAAKLEQLRWRGRSRGRGSAVAPINGTSPLAPAAAVLAQRSNGSKPSDGKAVLSAPIPFWALRSGTVFGDEGWTSGHHRLQSLAQRAAAFTTGGKGGVDSELIEKSLAIPLIILVTVWLLYVLLRLAVSSFVRQYIEAIDTELIGVDVFIKRLWISSIFPRIRVHLSDVKVCNPAGYKERYMATLSYLEVKIDSWRFLMTGLTVVDILELRAKHVLVNYEKSWTRHKSNVSDIIHFLYYGEGSVELPSSGREYIMHKIAMDDVEVVSKFKGFLGSSEWHLPTEHFELLDVAKASRMDTIVRLVVGTLLNRVQERQAAGRLQQVWRRRRRSDSTDSQADAIDSATS